MAVGYSDGVAVVCKRGEQKKKKKAIQIGKYTTAIVT